MKKLTTLFFIVSILGLGISCDDNSKDTTPEYIGDPFPPTYQISNWSGHTVSIVHQPSCEEMPDSLILLNRTEFYLATEMDGYYGKIPMEMYFFDKQLIYYDGRYVMNIKELPIDRYFPDKNLYTFWPKRWTYEFILSKEDYDYAVKNGTDLGESIP